jgi:hypothetical protein
MTKNEEHRTPSLTDLRLAISHQRAVVRSCELAVEAAREALDRDLEALQTAVRDRDRALVHLAHLRDWFTDVATAA